jgi:hypothetical protein
MQFSGQAEPGDETEETADSPRLQNLLAMPGLQVNPLLRFREMLRLRIKTNQKGNGQ